MSNSSATTAQLLGHMAARSLEGEARLTPKPGLVDSANTGAHKDMNLKTFLVSAEALEPYFIEYAAAGMRLGPNNAASLAAEVRHIGIGAEKAMFEATGGINTHKGANFTFALVLAACGALISEGTELPFTAEDSKRALTLVSDMGAALLDHDMRELLGRTSATGGTASLTNGEQVYLKQGLKGIRGEAAQGYPLLGQVFLPYVRSVRSEFATEEGTSTTLLRALVKLMAQLDDTNVVHRGGMEALERHLAHCKELDAADLNAKELVAALDAYNDELVAANVSPGGAADLLSLGIFFCQLEGIL